MERQRQLRIGFTDIFESAKQFFTAILGTKYQIIRDDVDPQVLIYADPNFGNDHWRYDPSKVRKVFYTGENVRPNYFLHDYAMTFDHVNSPYHYRLPLYILEMWSLGVNDKIDFGFTKKRSFDAEWLEKTKSRKFAYVQTNPNCIPRNEFMATLMAAFPGHVYCAGPHLNNTGLVLNRSDIHTKLDFCRTAKFTICFENGTWPGYVTEKLLNSYVADSLPIYWGSPTVGRDFSEHSFVNRHRFANDDHLIEWINWLDTDNDAYLAMLNNSPLPNQQPNEAMYLNNFIQWWDENVMRGL